MLPKTHLSSYPTNILRQCRNASTRHVKKGVKKNLNAPPKAPKPNTVGAKPTPQPSNLASQTWIIEPRISYWQAKLRTPKSPFVILVTVGFAASSIFLTSSAFPDPSETPENDTERNILESISDTLLFPIKFVFRPLFVEEDIIADSQKSWRYKAGFAAGLCSISLFVLSHFATPRYARYIAISTRSATPSKIPSSAVMEVYPAFSQRSVSHHVSRSVLVSPLLDKRDQHRVLRTIRIVGPPGTVTKMGWGVNMFRGGALVNGKHMPQEKVVELMERIWVENGGRITVA